VDLAAFRTRFPEFRSCSDAQVTDALAVAAGQLPSGSLEQEIAPWFGYADTAHGLLAAHGLALSPSGQSARLVPPRGAGAEWAGQTTYYARFDQLRTEVTVGERFCGHPPIARGTA
jgi:hypothetical protein